MSISKHIMVGGGEESVYLARAQPPAARGARFLVERRKAKIFDIIILTLEL